MFALIITAVIVGAIAYFVGNQVGQDSGWTAAVAAQRAATKTKEVKPSAGAATKKVAKKAPAKRTVKKVAKKATKKVAKKVTKKVAKRGTKKTK